MTKPSSILPSQSSSTLLQSSTPPAPGHQLRTRFLATPAFQARYEQAYRRIYADLFISGRALAIVDTWQANVATALAGEAALPSLATHLDDVRSDLVARTEALARHPVLTAAEGDLPVGPMATYPAGS